ncbi:MAG: hypothetical protein OEV36_01420 [Myxococcales bacterium]|nr:hypothetical protein [Myxococcales bacterium]
MAWLVRARSISMAVIAELLAAPLGGCGGEAELGASFDYEMPARFVVPALRAPEEQSEYEVYVEGPLQPDAWRVRFDACGSMGSPVKYTWRIDGNEVGVETRCDTFEYEFPAEGEYLCRSWSRTGAARRWSRPRSSTCGTC